MKKWFWLLLLPLASLAASADPLDPAFKPTVDQVASHYSTSFGTITVTDSLYKVMQSSALDPTMNHWYVGNQMRNEFQSIQVHINPSNFAPSVDVTMSNLVDTQTTPSSIIFATSTEIEIYKVHYITVSTATNTAAVAYNKGILGQYPDVLIPKVDPYWGQNTAAFPLIITSTETRTAWIDVHIPTSSPSGYYYGSIYVSSGGVVVSTLPVSIGVWNWIMPSSSTLMILGSEFTTNGMCTTSYGGTSNAICGVYPNAGGFASTADQMQSIDGDYQLLDNRYTAYEIDHQLLPPANTWNKYLSYYSNLLNGLPTHFPVILKGAAPTAIDIQTSFAAANWQNFVSTYTQQGWINKLGWKAVDEPNADCTFGICWQTAVASMTATRAFSTPQAPNIVTTDFVSMSSWSAKGVIDWVVPIVNDIDNSHNSAHTRSLYDSWLTQSSGPVRQIGSYLDCESGGSCANGTVSSDSRQTYVNRAVDGTPVSNRAMETFLWKSTFTLELYYSINQCDLSPSICNGSSAWNSLYAFGNNGDGTLILASTGTYVSVSTPIWCPTIRLKHFRDGDQDYEYEHYLDTSGYNAFVSTWVATWLTDGYTFSNDPAGIRAMRLALGNQIHALNTTPQAPIITNSTFTVATVSQSMSFQMTAANSPTSWNCNGPPNGITINTSNGLISGTPTSVGLVVSTLSATNSVGSSSQSFTFNIVSSAPVITSANSASGTVGSAFSYQITATNSPTTFDADVLPSGLSVGGVTGLISGTPTTAAVSTTTISATNGAGTGTELLTITINSAPPPPPPPLSQSSSAMQGPITIQGRVKFQ